jgi:uncharacterized protein
LVLDHHKTAMNDLSGLTYALFDMSKSGAVLAWEHFFPGEEVPELFRYLQDRDLWKKELPLTEEVFCGIQSFEKDLLIWKELLEKPIAELAAIGTPILEERRTKVCEMADRFVWVVVGGYRVPAAFADWAYSDVANLLCQRYPQAPFAACWRFVNGKRKWDLRSIGDFDVSVVAKGMGGGGHRSAAGFEEELS